MKLHEIADTLELTESRISQIRTKALAKLRAAVGPVRAGLP
jgi:RNA polymerase sigma factor for flagellar operon FliA